MTHPADVVLEASKILAAGSYTLAGVDARTGVLLGNIADAMTCGGAVFVEGAVPVAISGPDGYDAVWTSAYDLACQVTHRRDGIR